MTPLIFATLPVLAPGAVLPILAAVAIVAGGVVVYNVVHNKTSVALASAPTPATAAGPVAGILSHLGQLLHAHTGGQANHRIASIAWSGMQKLLAYDAAQQHKEFDALMQFMGVKGVAAVPIANAGLDLLDKQLGITPEDPPELHIARHQLAVSFWQQRLAKQQQQATNKAA